MPTIDLGTLTAGKIIKKTDAVSPTNTEVACKFKINANTNVNLSAHELKGNSNSDLLSTPDLLLFRDSDNNGQFNRSVDQLIVTDDNGVDSNLNLFVGKGTYFAVARQGTFADKATNPFELLTSITPQSLPSDVIGTKFDFGTLTKSDKFSQFLGNNNTSDVYGFTLKAGDQVSVVVDGLTQDADVRFIKDTNNNRIVDTNELVGASLNAGTTPEGLANITQPGHYLVQVYQFTPQFSTSYNIKLNFRGANDNIPDPGDIFGHLPPSGIPINVSSLNGGTVNGSNLGGILVGQSSKDTLLAHGGDDIVLGGDNDDLLNGGAGNDHLFGGKGHDILIGGAGSDTLVLARHQGLDIVKGFHIGQDLIGLANNLKFEDLHFVHQTKGTLVKAGNESLAFLQGVQSNQLSAASFGEVSLAKLTANVPAGIAV